MLEDITVERVHIFKYRDTMINRKWGTSTVLNKMLHAKQALINEIMQLEPFFQNKI